MKPLHRLLKRQLIRSFGDSFSIPEEWQGFIRTVNDAYLEADADREMLERSLDLSSQELLQANSEMRAIFQAIPDLLFQLDSEGTILDCKAGSTKDFVLRPREQVGKRVQDVPLKSLGAKFHEAIRQVKETKSIVRIEYSLLMGDEKRLYEARLVPLFEDRIISIIRDITKDKLAEDALKESEEKYRNLVERANDGIIIIQDGIIRYANTASMKIWGGSLEEIVGIPFIDFIDPDEIPKVVERYQRRMANESIMSIYETILERRNGTEIFVELNAGMITFQGKPADLVMVRDITERKQMEGELRRSRDELELRVKERTEELARKNTEMERFIYTVSHDLRTPLISLSGFLGFIKQDAEKRDLERMNADLRIANEAVTKMDQLLMETLELSRIGRVVNPPEDVPFSGIVEDALGLASEKIRSNGFKVSVAQNLPVVHVDRIRIAEVLTNLIENSIKYMGLQANPEIEIGQRIDGEDRIFFVRDNGIGLDPSQRDKVFELFYKVDKKSDGTGAGLAIVKRIIEVHGGRIWIESELGQGCTLCFTLPLADIDKAC